MGATISKKEFTRVGTDEPHASRRKLILAKHPEIKGLYGPDLRLLPSVLLLVSLQLSLAVYCTQNLSVAAWVLIAWVFGGTFTHALSLANHELSHNLCFFTPVYNEYLGMVSNLAQGLPSCVTFKKYHLEHHYYQGVEGIDSDIPSEWEAKLVTNTFGKIIWVFLQPLAYALRPVIFFPKTMKFNEYINSAVTLCFNIWFAHTFGLSALLFNIISTLLGMGFHPVAGHFIAEHYTFVNNQETYSYYGLLNYLCFNVGYHNEHHDFPKISGFRLPEVRKIAPEFYQDLHVHESWTKVIFDYVFRSDVGPYSRVKRQGRTKTQ